MVTIAHEATGNVTVFTSEENRDHAVAALDDTTIKACTWIVKRKADSYRAFFKQVEQATTTLDVLWTITPYGHSEIVDGMSSFPPKCPSATFVHASSRFVPPRHPLVGDMVFPLVKWLNRCWPGPLPSRAMSQVAPYLAPRLIREYDSVITLYPTIVEFVEQHVESDALIDWFLPEFHRPNAAVDHGKLQITVPGRVNSSLRNYDLLFDVLDEIDGARDQLTVCLLGQPLGNSGERIIRRCERYDERGYDIQYYPSGGWVPEEEFAHQLAKTDLIFAPINIRGETGNRGQDRVRGRTITTGTIGDAIHIGRPLVMPQEFPVAPEFEDLITTYEGSADATALIESWAASEATRRELQQGAERAVQQFSLEQQAARFESLCRRTIEADGQ